MATHQKNGRIADWSGFFREDFFPGCITMMSCDGVSFLKPFLNPRFLKFFEARNGGDCWRCSIPSDDSKSCLSP